MKTFRLVSWTGLFLYSFGIAFAISLFNYNPSDAQTAIVAFVALGVAASSELERNIHR